MRGFLYFLPGITAFNEGHFKQFGLEHIRDRGDQIHRRQVLANGPDGLNGMVIGNARNWTTEEVMQSPDVEWRKFPKTHAELQAYCGVKGELPGPDDLARKAQLPGKMVELADGNQWLIPVARDASGNCCLPVTFDLDDENGKWIPTNVRKEHQKLWEHATRFFNGILQSCADAKVSGTDVRFVIEEPEQMVADTLTANYRVSARELATIGVLESGLAGAFSSILIDLDGYDSIKKKETSVTGNG